MLDIDEARLTSSNHVVVNCIPPNAAVLLNVSSCASQGVMNIGSQPLSVWENKLLWNFHQAGSVFFSNVEVLGVVLVPSAGIATFRAR